MKKQKSAKKISIITILIILALALLLFVSDYTGLIAVHEGLGGHIYGIRLEYREQTFSWAGIYGAAFGVGQTQPWIFEIDPGSMTEANLFFECLNTGGDTLLFASTVPQTELSIPTLRAATTAELNDYIGIDDNTFETATDTFTSSIDITIGGNQINNIPAVETRVGEGTDEGYFQAGALMDENDNIVIISLIKPTLFRGFNDRFYNYQMLVPVGGAQTTDYYVFIDPFLECPEGDADEGIFGNIEGVVTDVAGNPIENVIVTVGRFSGVSDETGFYRFSTDAGNRTLFTVREGYRTYIADVLIVEGETTIHNIILEEELPPSDFTDIGPDFEQFPEDGTDVGPGEVDPRPEAPEVIEAEDYWIPFRTISREIREGEFLQEVIIIQSFRNTQMAVQFEMVGNATTIASLDRESVVIPARGQANVTLTAFGRPPLGVYNGSIILTGAIEEEIGLELEVIDRTRMPVQAMLIGTTMSDKNIYSGSRITFRTDLTNLLTDREYPVQLFYTIQNSDGTETIWTDSGNAFLRTSLSLVKRADLPPNLPPGEYVIRTTARYLGLTSTSSHVFEVSLPFYQYILFGSLRVWHGGLILSGIIGLIVAIIIIRRRIEANKKYHLKVNYKELPKPGPRNAFVGKIAETDHKAYMNLENFKTHTIVAGSTGGGKSFSAQVIIEEMLEKDTAVIVFDPTAQWTGYLRKLTNKGLFGLYPSFGMKENEAKAFTGNIRQIDNPRELIDIRKFAQPGEINVFALHKLDPKDMDIFVANTVRQVFKANFEESEPLKICLVYDEVHRLLPKFGGSGEGFLQIERACREFRKWGIGVMLISQVLADFVGQIKANINTEVQMRTRDEGDLERISTKYGSGVLQSLVKASIGTGMVQNSAYNKGQPYFVTFRPIKHSVERLSDEEIAKYNEYNEKIDQLVFELEQLEELEQDVFDLKLELKLAVDKVKAGNFNMVNIYLEGLEPRIKKFWDKLGKQPKKLEKQYVSEEDIKAEVKKAQEERKKAEAEEKKDDPAEGEKKEDPSEKFKKDVPPDKILNLTNGMLVVNPRDLYAEIESMKDADFEKHVNNDKNDFADWVKDAVGDAELGALLSETKEKSEILKLIDLRSKGEKLPKPKNAPEENKEGDDSEDKPEKKEESENNPEENKEEEKQEDNSEENKEEEKPEDQESENPEENKEENNDEQKSDEENKEQEPQNEESKEPEVKEENKEEEKQEDQESESPEENKEEEKPEDNSEEKKEEEVPEENKEGDDSEDKPEKKEESEENKEEKKPEENEEEPNEPHLSNHDLDKKASSEQIFKLETGEEIHSLKELKESLQNMTEDVFEMHFNSEKNDFANWTEHVFGEKELAEKMREAEDKEELWKVIR